jgi:hypothetical protein
MSQGQPGEQLTSLLRAMKTYKLNFDGTEWFHETLHQIIKLPELSGIVARHLQSQRKTSHKSDWATILKEQPRYYITFVTMIDLSFSRGQLPLDGDLPFRIRFSSSIYGSITNSLVPSPRDSFMCLNYPYMNNEVTYGKDKSILGGNMSLQQALEVEGSSLSALVDYNDQGQSDSPKAQATGCENVHEQCDRSMLDYLDLRTITNNSLEIETDSIEVRNYSDLIALWNGPLGYTGQSTDSAF